MSEPARAPGRLAAHLRRDPALSLGLALMLFVLLATALGPLLDAHGALQKDVASGLSPLGGPLPPSWRYPFGTDMIGRCEASRVVLGARLSLAIAFPAALMAVAIGAVTGALAGYSGGFTDSALTRLIDAVLAFPFLLLIIALGAVLRESKMSAAPVVLVLGLSGWTTTARVIRARVLKMRRLDFIVAARALGSGHLDILTRHVFPNLAGPLLVLFTLVVADMLLAESALSFLELGSPPPTPSWGRMLAEGRVYLQGSPWLVLAPGSAILVTVLACNLIGEGLRRALDPESSRLSAQGGRAA